MSRKKCTSDLIVAAVVAFGLFSGAANAQSALDHTAIEMPMDAPNIVPHEMQTHEHFAKPSDRASPDALAYFNEVTKESAAIPSLTRDLALGQGAYGTPEAQALAYQTAEAITDAYYAGVDVQTADGQGVLAAGSVGQAKGIDPAFDERVSLAQQLFVVDGTDAITRKVVRGTLMVQIMQEVAKYINFNNLSDAEKYRLAGIVAAAGVELEDRILLLNAQIQAQILSRDELMGLIAAYSIPAQAKLTAVRLSDDSSIDSNAELEFKMAHYQIIRDFETRKK